MDKQDEQDGTLRLRAVTLICCVVLFAGLPAAQDKPPYPPLGRMVDVGDHRVHVYCTGQGAPTVMVVGAFSFDWALVQPEVAKFTRICTYDPAGSAWSEPIPVASAASNSGSAPTCGDRVGELHRLLGALATNQPAGQPKAKTGGTKPSYVLVGFSLGALVTRLYASQYPDEVAGMVIVDHAFQPHTDSPPSGGIPPSDPPADSAPVLISKTPIQLSVEDMSHFDKLPEKIRELHRWAEARRPALSGAETADDCLTRLKTAEPGPRPLGSMPLVVVSTGNESPGYQELQHEILSLSRNSTQLMVDSFHSVEIDQPAIVVRAIRQAVESVRGRGK
jgi:pimeloyl-ACP methyl ester carboxylesterase